MALVSLRQGGLDLCEPPLGAGGEGTVYRIARGEYQGCVAKIYHQPASVQKRQKLDWMISLLNADLEAVTAWPRDLVVDPDSGATRGFVMAEIPGAEPLHHYYSPTWQRQNAPGVTWSVLVRVARNTASAFATLHAKGIIIGDVNPNLAKVCETGLVKLIDCDSYQISSPGTDYLCDVGVPGFTPPELQTVSSFAEVRRTKNHDCFGLALLIFHLLFMGRHPFSGVPLENIDIPLEQAIREFRYAYSSTARQRGVQAPPASILPETLVQGRLIEAFEQAFTETGVPEGGRPSARGWVEALDAISADIVPCRRNRKHHFIPRDTDCPWCAFQVRHGLDFFPDRVVFADLEQLLAQLSDPSPIELIWERIQAIRRPTPLSLPSPRQVSVAPQPLAGPLQRLRRLLLVLRLSLTLAAVAVVLIAGLSLAGLGLGLAAAGLWLYRPRPLQEEHKRRLARRTATEGAMIALRKQIQFSDPVGSFSQTLEGLRLEKERFPSLLADYRREIDRMKELAIGPSLRAHLERHLIADARIAMLDETRVSVLASFGIESAADLATEKLLTMRGFGKVHIDNLMKWRKSIELSFRYDPHRLLTADEVQPVQRSYLLKKAHLLETLGHGADALDGIATEARNQQLRFQEEFRRREADAASAQADCTVI